MGLTKLRVVPFVVCLLLSGARCARVLPGVGDATSGLTSPPDDDPVPPVQNTSTMAQIVATAYDFLVSHEMIGTKWGLPFHYYRPSLQKYGPHQWLWDDGSHMITWSHKNVSNSIGSMRTMLQMQQADGRIPEIIFWGPQQESEIIQIALQYSSVQFVDLTQMPVLPFSLRAIFNATGGNPDVLAEFLLPLIRYFRWWAATRDVNQDGLVSVIHGWENASPMYDAAYNVTNPQPTWAEMYPQFTELILSYKWEFGWNQSAILGRGAEGEWWFDNYFIVQDVGVNSIYAAGWGVLGDLATGFNDSLAAECHAMQARVEAAILNKMWDSSLNRFVTTYRDPMDGVTKSTPVEAVQTLLPLLLNSLPQDKLDSIITTQLTNVSKFWLQYPAPSCSADAAEFQPVFMVDLMWRGPTWAFPNWFVMEGLSKHGRMDVAATFLRRWVALYELSGIWEHYNPLTGAPYGAVGLGMSTLIVDWLARTGWCNVTAGTCVPGLDSS